MSSHCVWISLFLLSVMTGDTGVCARAVQARGFVSPRPQRTTAFQTTSRAEWTRRRRRAVEETHRGERCAELAAPWMENTQQAPEDNATVLQLRGRPFTAGSSRGLVFPGKSLFNLVRRVYQCCQEGLTCRRVKGIQGRMKGDRDVEFLLTKEILSLKVMRAELHLHISNPHHLDVHPVLPSMAKRNLPTRYSLWSRGSSVELRVDLLFLLQSLQEVAGGARGGPSLVNMRGMALSSGGGRNPAPLQDADGHAWGDGVASELPALELGLVLGCSRGGAAVSCGSGDVHVSHTPFMALYYR
nr:uncharacterized protein si:ch211-170d8.2 [Solea senegalensis]